MRCTVEEAQARVSSKEFTEWQAYEHINPWGPERDDLRFAMLAATVVNAIRSAAGAKGRGATVHDFMLDFEPKPQVDPEVATQDMWATIRRAVGADHG